MESMLTAYHPMPRQLYVAREGHPFIAIALGATVLLWMTGLSVGAFVMLGITALVALFFRNPERRTPNGPGLVIAPADGRILSVTGNVAAPGTGKPSTRVSTFMSVANVHINRFPVAARVRSVFYHAGKFLVASLDKASEHNERNGLVLVDDSGHEIVMVQIAGLVARRIVCYVREGDRLARGERFGLIRFGSRVDLYLPTETKVAVAPGDRVVAGETVLGRFA